MLHRKRRGSHADETSHQSLCASTSPSKSNWLSYFACPRDSKVLLVCLSIIAAVSAFVFLFSLFMVYQGLAVSTNSFPYKHEFEACRRRFDVGPLINQSQRQLLLQMEPIEYVAINDKEDARWRTVLQQGALIDLVYHSEGIADKFVALIASSDLNGVYKAMLKIAVNPKDIKEEHSPPIVSFQEYGSSNLTRSLHRVPIQAQGWAEVAAYHVDRLLGIQRKPICVTRSLSSPELFNVMQHISYAPIRGRSTSTRLHRAHKTFLSLAQQLDKKTDCVSIKFSLMPWVHNLTDIHRSLRSLGHFMKYPRLNPVNHSAEYYEKLKFSVQASEVFSFDYIMDDHDHLSHNWFGGAGKAPLFLDNGLSFTHGPWGFPDKDRQILCGAGFWNRKGIYGLFGLYSSTTCTTICLFPKYLVRRLRAFNKRHTFGAELQRRMALYSEDGVFEHALYSIGEKDNLTSRTVVRFTRADFFSGFDRKIQQLLEVVDGCERSFGSSNTLV